MEAYEASRTIFTRIQNIDPDNASKIMGYLLLHHEKEDIVQFAYGPETLLLCLVNTAKSHLGISSNTLSAHPGSNPISISRPDPFSVSIPSLRLSNGFNPSSPSSPSIWSPHHVSVSPSNSSSNNLSFSGNSNNISTREGNNVNFLDDFQLKDPIFGPFVNDPVSLPGKDVDFGEQNLEYPSSYLDSSSSSYNGGETNVPKSFYHSRSSSFTENLPYFGGNFCDDNCGVGVGGPYDVNYEEEIIRAKLAHQHRLAAQLVTEGITLPFNKLNFLHSQSQRSAAALMMNDDFHKLNRIRMARNDLLGMDFNPSSRQIYLTFPADSTFKEEDVSNYFNKFGPVQDVRIPYQQKRMFGFVTFVFPETVKIILAKGNPHFVCDSRVLVKPYKEKGKLSDKKQYLHQFERGDFSCSSPSDDCREPYDFPLGGGRMMYNTPDLLMRNKMEEQAELQHALELQERRLMNLQLLNLKNQQQHSNVSYKSQLSSRDLSSPILTEENKEDVADGVKTGLSDSNGNVPKKEGSCQKGEEEDELFQSLNRALADNLFASPNEALSEIPPTEHDSVSPNSNNDVSKIPSCFSDKSRNSSGHEAQGM